MSFYSNNTNYGIVSDSEMNSIIGMFSPDMIYDVVQSSYENRFTPYQLYVGNTITALEQEYRQQLDTLPNYSNEIKQTRENTYKTILSVLCSLNNLSINEDGMEHIDTYSLLYYLYDFLISRYSTNIINFFANFILKEKDALYEMIGSIDYKKNKDNASTYSKKIFKGNSKLATIHANLELVIDNICGMDIPMSSLIYTTTYDQNITNIICTGTSEVFNLFSSQFVPCVKNPLYRPIIITSIRLRLQELAADTQVATL